jgi:hypothetical protein
MIDRSPAGHIIVSVYGTIVWTGEARDYPEGLAVWCADPYTSKPDYHFSPLHPYAQQDVLVLAYLRFCGER